MSFSDFYPSDLSDITSSSEEDAPPAKVKKPSVRKPKPDQKQPYTITQALRPPRSTSYSVRSLYEQIVDGEINLDPDYQRDVVWPEAKQIGLIDSVIRNYYIPPLIFAVSTSQDGSEARICIDGKQRLTSIQKFMDGLIPHRDHITAKRYWWKKQHGANAKALLPKTLQQAFANKQIVCVEYDGLTSEQEREIFQRVQLGVALTPAERMQAISGPWPSFIREIQSQVLGDDGFGHSFDWGRARGKDFHGLASIVYLIEQLPARKMPPTSATMDRWLTRTTPVPQKLRTGILDTFRVYLSLIREKDYKKPFAQRVSPVEFVMIGVMIYMKREILSLTQLSHAVEKLRADVRTAEKDVRTNGRTTKLLFKFIMEKLPNLALRSDGQGDRSAQSVLRSLPRAFASTSPPAPIVGSLPQAAGSVAQAATLGSASAPSRPKKRRRQVEDGEGDSDSSEPDGGGEEEYVPRRRYTRRAPDKASLQPSPSASHDVAPAPTPVSVSTSPQMPVNASTTSPTPTPSLIEPGFARPRTSAVAASASTSASVPPTPVVPAHTLPLVGIRQPGDSLHSPSLSDQPVLGSAVAPIDLDALEKLQQILTFSAGINAVSNTAQHQQQQQQQMQQALQQQFQTHSQLAQLASMRQFQLPQQQLQSEQQDQSNLGRVMALQQLQALLAIQPPQQLQQLQQLAQQQGQAVPITVPFTVPHSPRPTIKAEYVEPSLSSPRRWAPAPARAPHSLDYRNRRSRSRSRSRERDYDRRGGNDRGGEWREYSSRRGPPSYPRSRSRSRSRSESRSRRGSHSRPADLRPRIRSRSRSPDRGYHDVGNIPHRGWDQQQHRGIPSGPGPGPGPGLGPSLGPSLGGGSAPGSAGRRPSSPSSILNSASAPAGIARKFDFTRREREFGEFGGEQRPLGVQMLNGRGRGRGRGRARGRVRGVGFRGTVP